MTMQLPMVLMALVVGCGGDTVAPDTPESAAKAVEGALLAKSWPVRMADDATRARFEQGAGWKALFQSELNTALGAFSGSDNAIGVARVHLELAGVYRQGALLAANATHHVYGEDAQESDPVELAYVVGVSRVIRGDADAASASLAAVPADGATADAASRWKAWMAADHTGAPDLDWLRSFAPDMGDVRVGETPVMPSMPHYTFVERTEQRRELDVNDPTMLLALSEWHEAAAFEAAPESEAGVMAQLNSLQALWVSEGVPAEVQTIDDTWLFASGFLCAEDIAFVSQAKITGVSAVDAWKDRSILAAAVAPAIKDGKVNPERVLDQGMAIFLQIRAQMADVAGEQAGFHREFARFAQHGVLLAGMHVADAADQYRDAGILRLAALERMSGADLNPLFAMGAAAWDAGNRNPIRPEDLLHVLIPSFPALATARPPLEALHLRRSRHAAPTTPVN